MKTKIIIEINTDFKPFIMKDDFDEPEDYKKDVEDTFHNRLFELIEEFVIDEDAELQNRVIDTINEEYLSNNEKDEELKEWGQLGKININVSQEELKIGEEIRINKCFEEKRIKQ